MAKPFFLYLPYDKIQSHHQKVRTNGGEDWLVVYRDPH